MTMKHLADYGRNSVLSASPERLVVMLYDRMLLDLRRAERAQHEQDWAEAREQLLHAQEILAELTASLRPEAWEGGPGLASIYSYLREVTIDANVHRARAKTAEAIALIEPLAEAWRVAAGQSVAAETATA